MYTHVLACVHFALVAAHQAKNTSASHSKLAKAIKTSHAEKLCIFSQNIDGDAAMISSQIRTILQKFRIIAGDMEALRVVKSKADTSALA